jgi:hypothetical protein
MARSHQFVPPAGRENDQALAGGDACMKLLQDFSSKKVVGEFPRNPTFNGICFMRL